MTSERGTAVRSWPTGRKCGPSKDVLRLLNREYSLMVPESVRAAYAVEDGLCHKLTLSRDPRIELGIFGSLQITGIDLPILPGSCQVLVARNVLHSSAFWRTEDEEHGSCHI
jgi:hypothetical protein